MKKFAVIGAGAGGLAMAGHLALLGHEVRLFNRTAERILAIKSQGGVRLRGIVEGSGELTLVSSEIVPVLSNADVVVVAVPAYAHMEIATMCAPHLRGHQIVVLTPGRTGGALEFARTLQRAGGKEVVIAETQTILHTCRSVEEATVSILAVKRQVRTAALPAAHTSTVLEMLQPVFPEFVAANDVLETSLGNVGAILHPCPTLLNAGWIETLRTSFLHYYEGITPSIAAFLERLDRERLDVAQALGVSVPTVREWLFEVYGSEGKSLFDAIQATGAYRDIYAPQALVHRYIFEDVPTGLVPLASIGSAVGVNTPAVDLVINLASELCQVDFRRRGRTVDTLGLAGLGKEGLCTVARFGYPK